MKKVQILSPSEIPINMIDAEGVDSVVEVESREVFCDVVPKSANSISTPVESSVLSVKKPRAGANNNVEMVKIRRLIKKTKVKVEKAKGNAKTFCSKMKFVLNDEVKNVQEDGAFFYKKFFAPMALDIFKKRSSRVQKRDASFLLKIYKDADAQDLDILLARLFLGALGLKRNLRVRVIL